MKKTLLKETKIGEFLTIGAEMDEDEVGIIIASADVSASCAFKFDEWEKFVDGINETNEVFKKTTEEGELER